MAQGQAVGAAGERHSTARAGAAPAISRPIYTPAERARRDATVWTTVQAVLAPLQFLVFLVSLALVLHALVTGTGEAAAAVSVVVKTLVLYTIMVTGAVWERAVFGQYLFAPSFFWEDAVSMLVIALHTAYLVVLLAGVWPASAQLTLALAAYAAYAVNAAQFVWKMMAAKRAERVAVPA
jgi:3-vinyl bacteriochlorophyllide hydratase